MYCENKFCVFQREWECTVSESVEMNILGLCTSCIYVDIEDEELDRLKEAHLDRCGQYEEE